jgi:1,4-dihydroxy-2-naphthoate octaprenyltransferase
VEHDLIEYINSELLILAAVLMALGRMLKQAALIKDKMIPLLLGLAGIVLALLWSVAERLPTTAEEWLGTLFSGTVQGILCAATAVYGHQLIKQSGKKE